MRFMHPRFHSGFTNPMVASTFSMEKLWAPWRMPFIQSTKKKKPSDCIFCKASRERKDKANFVLGRGEYSVALLNIFPYNNGHLMIAPMRHTGDFNRISGVEWQDMMALMGECQRALEKTLHPHGYNIGINLGRAAGAGIEDHLHIHLIPRWAGDTNFMTAIGETRVLPEDLTQTASRLRPIFERLSHSGA